MVNMFHFYFLSKQYINCFNILNINLFLWSVYRWNVCLRYTTSKQMALDLMQWHSYTGLNVQIIINVIN